MKENETVKQNNPCLQLCIFLYLWIYSTCLNLDFRILINLLVLIFSLPSSWLICEIILIQVNVFCRWSFTCWGDQKVLRGWPVVLHWRSDQKAKRRVLDFSCVSFLLSGGRYLRNLPVILCRDCIITIIELYIFAWFISHPLCDGSFTQVI